MPNSFRTNAIPPTINRFTKKREDKINAIEMHLVVSHWTLVHGAPLALSIQLLL